MAPFVGVTSGSQDTPAGLELVTQRFGTRVVTLVKHIVGVLAAGLRLKLETLKGGVFVAEILPVLTYHLTPLFLTEFHLVHSLWHH